ncbi:hypothetical protein T12_3476 [Trichinella patagoniensis]|uniref:Uncharacterized protein n=1 Tax=Trichinella patagoniensis TaxID=990121 RepID=A0A0V1A502_9BILA|nr:hypothetical protein T12_3476 [Trichinella patagoniensis]
MLILPSLFTNCPLSRGLSYRTERPCTTGFGAAYHELLHRSNPEAQSRTSECLPGGCASKLHQSTFIRKGIADALGLTGQCETVTFVTIRDQKREKWQMRRVGFLLGIDNDSTLCRLHVLATPKICLRVQQTAADPEEWQHLTALKLADQLQKHPVIIDVLIGLIIILMLCHITNICRLIVCRD